MHIFHICLSYLSAVWYKTLHTIVPATCYIHIVQITGVLNNVFRPQKILKKTRIKLYNTLALPVLLYGSETWTVKARDARRITAAEMKYMRRTAGYIWTDYKTNAQIAKELKITPILDKLLEYKRNWI